MGHGAGQRTYDSLDPTRGFDCNGSAAMNAAGRRAWVLRRPSSHDARLIIDLYPTQCAGCCGQLQPFADESVAVPPAVASRGVSQAEWQEFVETLSRVIRGTSVSVLTQVLCWLPLLTVPCLYLCGLNRFQAAVKDTVDRYNASLFEPKGLYAKTQKIFAQMDRYHEELSWLTIALTEEEEAKLRAEQHVFAYNPLTRRGVPNDGVFQFCNSCCGTEQVV